jgi:hypothetical protein
MQQIVAFAFGGGVADGQSFDKLRMIVYAF